MLLGRACQYEFRDKKNFYFINSTKTKCNDGRQHIHAMITPKFSFNYWPLPLQDGKPVTNHNK